MLFNGMTLLGVFESETDTTYEVTRPCFLREVMTQGGIMPYLSEISTDDETLSIRKDSVMILPFNLDLTLKEKYIEAAFPSPIIKPDDGKLIL